MGISLSQYITQCQISQFVFILPLSGQHANSCCNASNTRQDLQWQRLPKLFMSSQHSQTAPYHSLLLPDPLHPPKTRNDRTFSLQSPKHRPHTRCWQSEEPWQHQAFNAEMTDSDNIKTLKTLIGWMGELVWQLKFRNPVISVV